MMSESNRTNPTVFRARKGYLMLGFLLFFLLGIDISTWYTSSRYNSIDVTLWSVFFTILASAAYVRPKIIFFDEGLTIINPIETYTLSWKSVQGVDARLTLMIYTREKRISAWAATGPTPRQARRATRLDKIEAIDPRTLGLERGVQIGPADLPESDTGAAAAIARYRMVDFNRAANPTIIEETFERNYSVIGAAALCGIIAAIMLLFHK